MTLELVTFNDLLPWLLSLVLLCPVFVKRTDTPLKRKNIKRDSSPADWGGSQSQATSSPPVGGLCWQQCVGASVCACFWHSGQPRLDAEPQWQNPHPQRLRDGQLGHHPYPAGVTWQSWSASPFQHIKMLLVQLLAFTGLEKLNAE